jgi:hypothetical protein
MTPLTTVMLVLFALMNVPFISQATIQTKISEPANPQHNQIKAPSSEALNVPQLALPDTPTSPQNHGQELPESKPTQSPAYNTQSQKVIPQVAGIAIDKSPVLEPCLDDCVIHTPKPQPTQKPIPSPTHTPIPVPSQPPLEPIPGEPIPLPIIISPSPIKINPPIECPPPPGYLLKDQAGYNDHIVCLH